MSQKVKVTFTYDQKQAYKVIKKLYRKVPKSDRRPLEFDEIEKALDTKEYFKLVATIGTLGDSSRDQAKVFRHFINFQGLEPAAAAEQILTNQLDLIVYNLFGISTYKDFQNTKLIKGKDAFKKLWTTITTTFKIDEIISEQKNLVKFKKVIKKLGLDESKTANYVLDSYFGSGRELLNGNKEKLKAWQANMMQAQWVKKLGKTVKVVDGLFSVVDAGINISTRAKDVYQDRSLVSFWLLFASLTAEGLSRAPGNLKILGDLMGLTFTVTDFAGDQLAAYNRYLDNEKQRRNKFSRVSKSILIDRLELCSNSSSDVDKDGCDDVKNAPTLTSATYDFSTGVLAVTGTNIEAQKGDNNDINISKIIITGEGGSSKAYTLTSSNVERISETSFSVTLNNEDQFEVARLFNKNGTRSGDGTTYNIAVVKGWNPGSSISPSDSSGNSITISNVKDSLVNPDVFDKVKVNDVERLNRGLTYVASPLFDDLAEIMLNRGTPLMIVPSLDLTDELLLTTPDAENLSNEELEALISSQFITGYYHAKYFKNANTETDNHEVILSTDNTRPQPHNYSFPDKTFFLRTDIRNADDINITIEVQHADREGYKLNDGMINQQTDRLEIGPFSRWTDHELNKYYQYSKEGKFLGMAITSFRLNVNTNPICNGSECSGRPIIVKLSDGTYLNLGHSEVFDFDIHHMVAEEISIASATYDFSTGVLDVTGTNIEAQVGDNNDIDISKITITGEGASSKSYTLTSSNVERISETSFSATLNDADQLILRGLLNKNGTSSGDGTTYNIAFASDWNLGATSSPSDSSGNVITVSNVTAPSLISATYDNLSGILTLSGTNFPAYHGASNDINVAKLTISGGSNSTYTLTSTDVELTSATSASISLNNTDQTNLHSLLNKNGTSSSEGTTYNIAAADNWAPGADLSVDIADATGNMLTVSNVTDPTQGDGQFELTSSQAMRIISRGYDDFRLGTYKTIDALSFDDDINPDGWDNYYIPLEDCNSFYFYDFIIKTNTIKKGNVKGKATVTMPSGNTYTEDFTISEYAKYKTIKVGPIPIADEIGGSWKPHYGYTSAHIEDMQYRLDIPGSSISQGLNDNGEIIHNSLETVSANILRYDFYDYENICPGNLS